MDMIFASLLHARRLAYFNVRVDETVIYDVIIPIKTYDTYVTLHLGLMETSNILNILK